MGHFANKCPTKKPNQGSQKPAPTWNGNQGQQNYVYGKVNHVTAEEAQLASKVMFGTFPANLHPTTILFDSGELCIPSYHPNLLQSISCP